MVVILTLSRTISIKLFSIMIYKLQSIKRRKQNNVRKKKAAYAVDPFSRLPNELFLSILSRLPDLKSLCQYSLVSKHFASVISQLQFVSLTLQNKGVGDTPGNLRILRRKLDSARPGQIPRILDSLSLQHLKLPKFLNHFKELESIYLEYTAHPEKDGDDPSFPKWIVEFANTSSNKVNTFVAVLPDYLHKKIECEANEEQVNDDEDEYPLEFRRSDLRYCYRKSYWLYVEFMCLICMLVKSHATIKSITIADSDKRGKLVMGKEQLVKLRRNISKQWSAYSHPHNMFFFAPNLHLPVSGYVMRGLSLTIFSETTDLRVIAESAKEKMLSTCEEDEKLVYEVVIETLKLAAADGN